MAEQKSEDTKQPLPRRGARPFAGPLGAAAGTRPFLRPPAPGQRTGPAPFAPPAVPSRSALGGAVVAAVVNATEPPVAAQPIEAPLSASAGPPSAPDAAVTIESVVPIEPTTPPASARPIPSEMMVLDAIDAFDAMWASASDVADETQAFQSAEPNPAAPPLDESSLGTLDASSAWADEITGAVEQAAPRREDPPPRASAGLDMPAWLADDHEPPPVEQDPTLDELPLPETAASETLAEEPPASLEPASLELVGAAELPARDRSAPEQPPAPETSAPEVTTVTELEGLTPASVAAVEGHGALGGDRPRFELVEEIRPLAAPTAGVSMSQAVDHGRHVSAALDRLADRIRMGEIDVSSIAPEASDAAMLASVLAALLGGSSSR